MTNTHTPTATLPIDDQEVHERRIPRQRTRTGFDDEIARLIRDRVQADLAKRSARRRRHREEGAARREADGQGAADVSLRPAATSRAARTRSGRRDGRARPLPGVRTENLMTTHGPSG